MALKDDLERAFGNCGYGAVTIFKDLRPNPSLVGELDLFAMTLNGKWRRLWLISSSVMLIIGDSNLGFEELSELLERTSFACYKGSLDMGELAQQLHDYCGLDL